MIPKKGFRFERPCYRVLLEYFKGQGLQHNCSRDKFRHSSDETNDHWVGRVGVEAIESRSWSTTDDEYETLASALGIRHSSNNHIYHNFESRYRTK